MPIPLSSRAVTEYRRYGALLGFLLKAEVDAVFKQQPFKTESDEDPLDLWRKLEERRGQLLPVQKGELAPIPEALAASVEAIKQRSAYKEYYEPVADYVFGAVSIASLLSPQCFVDLDYIDELAESISASDTTEGQLHFAFSDGQIAEPVVAGNTVLFSSARRDLYADAIPSVVQTAEGEFSIVVRARSRPNYIQVAHIDDQLFLINGVHKVCALHRAGFTNCYCVFREASSLAEAGVSPQSTTMLRDQVSKGPRPAAVLDFLNPDVAANLRLRSMQQVLQIVIQSATFTVPTLAR